MSSPAPAPPEVDAVVIGRNEGARLVACLASLRGQVRRVVYVDSGSTDGSVEAAQAAGAEVVALDMTRPFTAARARNAGLARLEGGGFVQLLDGDCELRPGWIAAALRAFADHPRAVVVCGRRRERHPEVSVWNRLCDREWDTPVGQAAACGGDALMRLPALRAAGGYREDLIAGEEPELCLRLRGAGGEVWRIDAEMTLHDAGMTRFPQWWRRSRRAGHAFAEGAALHGAGPERHWVAETRRALLWGFGVPLAAVAAGLVHPAGGLILLTWPLQMMRLAWRWRGEGRAGAEAAVFTVLGKLPEALGVLDYCANRLRGRRRGLIEYK
ncbi:glycosyltransferase family 2 protein [Rhodobacter sp. SGA-6-6]|uniref:glycosyltransferase family 2 protein n=1 Tax=Rhodobacter sp. SGA-6-6 TaxID=2710882 RepID=UPI0013EDA09A|nr:glycosyltransferase [Rhodobacter sp. SGA-6-6]NGM44057.1 glycosyltransferase family 2 protein [Rhodobacter sp. SGA-6-6]